MGAHQCDINGNLPSHLCSYIWYLINKNKWGCPSQSRNQIWHQRTNSPLTTAAQKNAKNCVNRLICPRDDIGYFLMGCIFHFWKLSKYWRVLLYSYFIQIALTRLKHNVLGKQVWPLAEKAFNITVFLFSLQLSLCFNWFMSLYFEHTAEVTKGDGAGQHNRVCYATKKKQKCYAKTKMYA